MSIVVQDVLTDPMGSVLAGVVFKVIAENNNTTVKTAGALFTTDSMGNYSFNLSNNIYSLYVKVDNTFEPLGKCIVEDSTPTPVTINELLKYTAQIVIPNITNPDPVWEDLYAAMQADLQVNKQEDLEQIREEDVFTSDTKHIWVAGSDNGNMADDVLSISTSSSSITKRPIAYSDDSQNYSAQDSTDITIPLGSLSKSLDIRSTDSTGVQATDSTNITTPDGNLTKNISISNSSSMDSEAVSFGGNSFNKSTELTGTNVTSNETTQHATGDFISSTETGLTYEYGYRDDDQVEIPEKPKLERLDDMSLVGGTHDIHLVSKLLARINQMGEAIVELRKEITVNNKTVSMVQSNDGFNTSVIHTADKYVVQDNEGNAALTVDTANNEVNVKGRLNIENVEDFKGDAGTTKFQVLQYSIDNANWHDDWVEADIYRRWNDSIDGYIDPNAWSVGVLFTAQDGLAGDTLYIEYAYSINKIVWHSDFEDGDIWRKERTIKNGLAFTEWTDAARITGADGLAGEIVTIVYEYSVDGFEPWHSNFTTGDHFRRERLEYFKTVADQEAGTYYKTTDWYSAAKLVPVFGEDYFSGESGKHGSGSYIVTILNESSIPDDAGKDANILTLSGRAAQAGDILTYTDAVKSFSSQYLRGDSTWEEFTLAVNGSAIINGTLAAEKLKAATITGDKIAAGAITSEKITLVAADVGADAAGSASAAQTAAISTSYDSVTGRIYPNQSTIQIKSSTYTAGSTGWAIDAGGTAEFNNMIARGVVYADSGSFNGDVTTENLSARGDIKSGSTITGATISSSVLLGSTIYGTSILFVCLPDNINTYNYPTAPTIPISCEEVVEYSYVVTVGQYDYSWTSPFKGVYPSGEVADEIINTNRARFLTIPTSAITITVLRTESGLQGSNFFGLELGLVSVNGTIHSMTGMNRNLYDGAVISFASMLWDVSSDRSIYKETETLSTGESVVLTNRKGSWGTGLNNDPSTGGFIIARIGSANDGVEEVTIAVNIDNAVDPR